MPRNTHTAPECPSGTLGPVPIMMERLPDVRASKEADASWHEPRQRPLSFPCSWQDGRFTGKTFTCHPNLSRSGIGLTASLGQGHRTPERIEPRPPVW